MAFIKPWNLPLLPPDHLIAPYLTIANSSLSANIPQHVWIPLSDVKNSFELPHLKRLQRENSDWIFHFEGKISME